MSKATEETLFVYKNLIKLVSENKLDGSISKFMLEKDFKASFAEVVDNFLELLMQPHDDILKFVANKSHLHEFAKDVANFFDVIFEHDEFKKFNNPVNDGDDGRPVSSVVQLISDDNLANVCKHNSFFSSYKPDKDNVELDQLQRQFAMFINDLHNAITFDGNQNNWASFKQLIFNVIWSEYKKLQKPTDVYQKELYSHSDNLISQMNTDKGSRLGAAIIKIIEHILSVYNFEIYYNKHCKERLYNPKQEAVDKHDDNQSNQPSDLQRLSMARQGVRFHPNPLG